MIWMLVELNVYYVIQVHMCVHHLTYVLVDLTGGRHLGGEPIKSDNKQQRISVW